MLVDLKITTIGKIISSVLMICFVTMGLNILSLPITHAVDGDNASLSLTSTNGIAGGNIVRMSIDTDGFEASVLEIRYKAVGFTTLYYDLDLGFPLSSVQEGTDGDEKILTLFHTSNTLTGSDVVLTFEADPAGQMTADGSIEILAGTYLVKGENKVDLPTLSYVVKKNVAPALALNNITNEATNIPYNTDLKVTVTDPTDSYATFARAGLYETDGSGGWQTTNILSNHFTMPSGNAVSTGTEATIANKGFLKYQTLYRLILAIQDDQSEGNVVDVSFTTQPDNTAPGASTEAKVTKAQWSDTADDIVTEFSFVPTLDTAPGKLKDYFIFNKSKASFITNGYGGLTYNITVAEYQSQLGAVLSDPTKYLYTADFPSDLPSKITGGITAGSYEGVVSALKKLNFQSALLTLVTRDEGGNFSDPVQIVKIGDVRADTGGFPNGVVNLDDAKYLYKHMQNSTLCPLPALETIDPSCN